MDAAEEHQRLEGRVVDQPPAVPDGRYRASRSNLVPVATRPAVLPCVARIYAVDDAAEEHQGVRRFVVAHHVSVPRPGDGDRVDAPPELGVPHAVDVSRARRRAETLAVRAGDVVAPIDAP